jgi:hypothetical protein
MRRRESWALGLLMNTRGLIELMFSISNFSRARMAQRAFLSPPMKSSFSQHERQAAISS